MGWSDPKRVRRSVQHRDQHLGYVTTITYPGRDLTAFPEGSPYSEVVIADPTERHVALLQRFKEHWLIQCGECYGTTAVADELDDEQVMRIAQAILRVELHGPALVDALRERLEAAL